MRKNRALRKDLPYGWETRGELVRLIIGDDDFMAHLDLAGPIDVLRLDLLLFPQKSWHLAPIGFAAFTKSYHHHVAQNPDNVFTPSAMLALARNINGPWYLINGRMYLWDPRFNFDLAMFDGNLNDYVRFVGPK